MFIDENMDEDYKHKCPIENVWKLLDGSLADLQKIMPQVIENKPVNITEEVVGSVYRQKYKEGKRIEEYDVETFEYTNTPDKNIEGRLYTR